LSWHFVKIFFSPVIDTFAYCVLMHDVQLLRKVEDWFLLFVLLFSTMLQDSIIGRRTMG